MKKWRYLLSAMTVLLVACGQNETAQQESATRDDSGKYSPTITISIAKQLDENAGRYDDGDDINDNPMTRLTEEVKGIKMQTTLLGGDANNYATKLRLALTGSEDLPDVFPVYSYKMIEDMIDSGRVKAIDDDIEQYMSDRLKEVYKAFPETFYPVTRDGKTYGIANVPVLEVGQVMIIRQDWLDRLGLEAPTNLEEFAEVIRAFTEDDPDGNGKDDTYGFTYSGTGVYNTGWVADPVMLFTANSGKMIPGSWQEDENGELRYGSLHEGHRETLQLMADWHEKGYLFRGAAVTGAWDAMGEFTEGKAGIYMGRPWSIRSINDLVVNNPDAVVKAYPTLRQKDGQPSYQSGQTNDGWLMFNADFENMEAFFDYYDWIYGLPFGDEEFKYGYIQEYDFDIVEGEVVYEPSLFDPPKDSPFRSGKSLVTKNSPIFDEMKISYEIVVEGKEPQTAAGFFIEKTNEVFPSFIEGNAIAHQHRDEILPTKYKGGPTPTMKTNWEQLSTMEMEVFTNIIYGKADISAFDEFVEKWWQQGGEQITKEVNEWYETVKNQELLITE